MAYSFYESTIGAVRKSILDRKRLESERDKLAKLLNTSQQEYVRLLNAQKLLSTVSDENTERVLDFVTGMVNKTLQEVFNDGSRITLIKKLYGGSKPHIIVKLVDYDGREQDMVLQTGAGVRQVVSFMYTLCLIEIRKGRPIAIFDEKLNGLHKEAKRVIEEIIQLFSKNGFQFIFVEYGMNTLGKIYNVEKRGEDTNIVSLDGVAYDENCIFINSPDLSVLDENYEEEFEEDVSEVVIGK